jgi:hypothetical protein
LEELKRSYFGSHPDDPVVFHRKELVNKKPPFDALAEARTERRFNEELLRRLEIWEFTVITVVIDKLEHKNRYTVWRSDPYHYCLHALVERFVMFLERRDAQGDVLAESRGGKEDRRLKDSFERTFELGTPFVASDRIQARLTSTRLKVKSKANNIAGLQIADIIAHPSFRAVLARHNKRALAENFGGKIAEILERLKYDRDSEDRIEGWGRKMLP